MFSFGYITELTGSQRNSVLALMAFFVIGLLGLWIALAAQKKEKRMAISEEEDAESEILDAISRN
jgi:MFS transporter, UMF1 family